VEVLTLMLRVRRMIRSGSRGVHRSGLRLDDVAVGKVLALRCDGRCGTSIVHDRAVWVLVGRLGSVSVHSDDRLGLLDGDGRWRCGRGGLSSRNLRLPLEELLDGGGYG